jgi:hypothetical protein
MLESQVQEKLQHDPDAVTTDLNQYMGGVISQK